MEVKTTSLNSLELYLPINNVELTAVVFYYSSEILCQNPFYNIKPRSVILCETCVLRLDLSI